MTRLDNARKAEKAALKCRLALAGPAGSGKTFTALTIAKTFGEPILLIDTEHESASLYADLFEFDTLPWQPPYDPRELAATLRDAAARYPVIVVDSLSHFWNGEGGTLTIVDAAAARSRGNSYAGWKEGTPAQNEMVEGIIRCPSHVIATMRSKTEYVLEQDERGKTSPKKVGMAPVQRDGMEYEFTVTAELDQQHRLMVDKTRCHLLAGKVFAAGKASEMAELLAGWLDAGAPTASAEQVAELKAAMNGLEPVRRAECKRSFKARFGVPDLLLASVVDEARLFVQGFNVEADDAPVKDDTRPFTEDE